MEQGIEVYQVLVLPDEKGRITAINSSAFLVNTQGWVQIDEGEGDRYHHAQGNYLPTPLMDENGICLYRLKGGKIVQRSEAEMAADLEAMG